MLPIYKFHKDRDERLRSAKEAITALLKLDLYLAHKKELLDVCIWKITEADGKYKTRYWSEGATKSEEKYWRHEHVHEKKELITRLIKGERLETVFDDMVACTVTKEEHSLLSKSSSQGWQRYRDANIKVYDSMKSQWIGN